MWAPNRPPWALSLAAWLIAAPALAGVSPRNGNFSVAYRDIICEGSPLLTVERTYNSHSTEVGLFGVGWGTDPATHVTVGADGAVVLHENGTGARLLLRPPTSQRALRAGLLRLGDAALAQGQFDHAGWAAEAPKVASSDTWRSHYQRTLGVFGVSATGDVFRSSVRGGHVLRHTATGWTREDRGHAERQVFDRHGRLLARHGPKGSVYYRRDGLGRLLEAQDGQGRRLRYHLLPSGQVGRITGCGRGARYTYVGQTLVRSEDMNGNRYRFAYDAQRRLIRIGYRDGQVRQLGYVPHRRPYVQSDWMTGQPAYQYQYGGSADRWWTEVQVHWPGQQPPPGAAHGARLTWTQAAPDPYGRRRTEVGVTLRCRGGDRRVAAAGMEHLHSGEFAAGVYRWHDHQGPRGARRDFVETCTGREGP